MGRSAAHPQDLAFALSLDWDSLPGENKAGKARGTLDYFVREDPLTDLLDAARAKRPRYAW